MKDKRHIQSFNEHQENLNISDVSDSYEKSIINDFSKKKKEYEESEDVMNEYFSKIVDEMLGTSKSKEDLIKIKERLRIIPECASKVLLFRKILIKEKDFS